MSKLPNGNLIAACACGNVRIEASGPPIMHAACYCTDCQTGGHRLEALPGAAPVLDTDGGTSFLLYRRDRVSNERSAKFLRPYKINESSPTSRLVATCCNSAMYLDFAKGHWLSVYRKRFNGDVPPLLMRVCTKSKRSGVELSRDVPNHATHSSGFFLRLIAAWIPMLFHR